MCAVFFLASRSNVYGWYTGSEQGTFPACYFMLEHFYSSLPTVFYRTTDNSPYAHWVKESGETETLLVDHSPVPEVLMHELDRLQFIFITEWLFYPQEPGSATEVDAYRILGLPVQPVNIRRRKLLVIPFLIL